MRGKPQHDWQPTTNCPRHCAVGMVSSCLISASLKFYARLHPGRAAAAGVRLTGDRVRVRRVANGILLEPMVTDIDAWFAALDRFADVPFMEGGRQQPPMPATEDLFA